MYSLLLSGTRGGAGTTTTTANLAAALQVQGFKTISLDLNADNSLATHYGVHVSENGGWLPAVMDGQDWRSQLFEAHDGRCVLPYGYIGAGGDGCLRELLNSRPGMVSELIADIQQYDFDYLLIDSPTVTTRGYLGVGPVNLELLVCCPDVPSYSLLKRRQSELLTPNSHILINKTHPEVALFGDMVVLIREQFAASTVPVALHLDYSVVEALAFFESVTAASPDSQSARDFHALALWCSSTFKVRV